MKKKKIGTVVLFVVLALVLIFAVLYFCGVFDHKAPAPVEDEPAVEEIQDAENAGENEETAPVVDIEDVIDDASEEAADDKTPAQEPEVEVTTQPEQQTTTQQPAEQTTTQPEQKPDPQPQSSEGTATFNGATVRAVNSVNELGTAKKPFETVLVNGVPYKWDGSKWINASGNYAKSENEYSDIHLENGQWSGEHVGN